MSNNASINYNEALLIESFFKTKSQKKCYINVMNNHKLEPFTTKNGEIVNDYQNMYVRKHHGYAHITVVYYSKSNETSFRDFENRSYYYVTRLQYGNVLQLRQDLVEIWNEYNTSDLYVLVLDEKHNKIAEIPTKVLFNMPYKLNQSQNLDFLMSFNIEENSIVWKSVSMCASESEANALIADWQYMGNVKYNKYEERTNIKIISYNTTTGNKRNTIECKSMRQAFDLLKDRGFTMSYTTFKRRCKAEKPSLIESDKLAFYVTDKIDFDGPDCLNNI
jgi:hypothetical protein